MPTTPKKYLIILCSILLVGASFLITPERRGGGTALVSEQTKPDVESNALPTLPPPDLSRFDSILGSVASQAPIAGALFRKVGSDAPPTLTAHAYLVADMQSGTVYASNNENLRWPLASLTKLVTGAIALERGNLKGEMPYIETGQSAGDMSVRADTSTTLRYTGRDILKMMLVASNNDAAEALAQFYGRDTFIVGMNEKAKELGLFDTYFVDSSGISASNQSTVAELATLVRTLYRDHRELFRETTNAKVTVLERSRLNSQTFPSTNQFAGKPEFLGGKTGYTPEAGGNLISIFSYRSEPLLLIVLGSDDRFKDTEDLLFWFKQNYQ